MREYKFRGWDAVGEKGWVFGDLVHNQKVTRTGLEPRTMVGGYEVFPDSVGILTGIKDDMDNELYEGDICRISCYGRVYDATVKYLAFKGVFGFSCGTMFTPIDFPSTIKKIGSSYKPPVKEQNGGILETNLADCGLSVWTLSVCRNNGITTLGDLTKLSKLDFYRFRNCGRKTFNEVGALLEKYNLEWRKP